MRSSRRLVARCSTYPPPPPPPPPVTRHLGPHLFFLFGRFVSCIPYYHVVFWYFGWFLVLVQLLSSFSIVRFSISVLLVRDGNTLYGRNTRALRGKALLPIVIHVKPTADVRHVNPERFLHNVTVDTCTCRLR